MAPEDRRLVEIFMAAQSAPPGRLFSDNVLAGLKAALVDHGLAGVAPRRGVNTTEEHRLRHCELHQAVYELFADYMRHAPLDEHNFLDMPVRKLLEWSYRQTVEPAEKR